MMTDAHSTQSARTAHSSSDVASMRHQVPLIARADSDGLVDRREPTLTGKDIHHRSRADVDVDVDVSVPGLAGDGIANRHGG